MSLDRTGWNNYERAVQAQQHNVVMLRCYAIITFLISTILFSIGCVAADGYLLGVVAGGCIVGLSIPLLLVNLAVGVKAISRKLRQRAAAHIILSISAIIIGALGITGILPATSMGWAVIAPTLVCFILNILQNLAVCCVIFAMNDARSARRGIPQT